MHSIHELLEIAIKCQASDLILKAGAAPALRIDGRLNRLDLRIMTPELISEFAQETLFSAVRDRLVRFPDTIDAGADAETVEHRMQELQRGRELNVAFSIGHTVRVRAHLFLERCQIGIMLRVLPQHPPTLDQLGLPAIFRQVARSPRGLAIIGGPPGMGKTTTLAATVEEINSHRQTGIVTIEDPIEYLFTDRQSVIHQRQPGQDTTSFATALAGIARQANDVVVIGELRDLETTEAAIRLATQGCLVLTTLQGGTITDALSEIVGRFVPATRTAYCQMLADALLCVTAQVLVPCTHRSGRVAATEVLTNSPAVKARLRQGESWDYGPFIRESAHLGMNTLNQALEHLCRSEAITRETAAQYTGDPAELAQLLLLPR
jgi:twitching motility protein PilT